MIEAICTLTLLSTNVKVIQSFALGINRNQMGEWKKIGAAMNGKLNKMIVTLTSNLDKTLTLKVNQVQMGNGNGTTPKGTCVVVQEVNWRRTQLRQSLLQ